MSIEPIHSSDVTSSEPTGLAKPSSGSEFEQFLRETLGGTPAQAGGEPQSLRSWLELAEAWKITKTLRECRGNRSAAARSLGIGRRTLYAKMEKLQIAPTWAMRGRSSLDD